MPAWVHHTTRVVGGMVLKPHVNGTLVADGSEQTVTEVAGLVKFSGYIDLSVMEVGDEVLIRWYMRITPGGPFKKHAQATYTGVQDPPLADMRVKVLPDGARITLQQTSGTLRSFPYRFVKEE